MKILVKDVVKVEALPDLRTVKVGMKNARGEPIDMTIGVQALSEAASYAQKLLTSSHSNQLGENSTRPEWKELPVSDLTGFSVGIEPMLSPPAVILVCDPGGKYRIAYRMRPEHARELARQLLAEADRPDPAVAVKASH